MSFDLIAEKPLYNENEEKIGQIIVCFYNCKFDKNGIIINDKDTGNNINLTNEENLTHTEP